MEGIKVTLKPNQESDIQTFKFEDLGFTYFQWDKLNEDEKREIVLDSIMENICSFVDSIEEY